MGDVAAEAHDEHAGTELLELLIVGARANYCCPVLRNSSNGLEDLKSRTDVDSLRWFVEQQHPRTELKPLCQQSLLLIPATK